MVAKKAIKNIGNAHWSNWPNIFNFKQGLLGGFYNQVAIDLFGQCGPFCSRTSIQHNVKHIDLNLLLNKLQKLWFSKIFMPKSLILGINSATPYTYLENLLSQLAAKGYKSEILSDCLFESPHYFLKLNAYIKYLNVVFPVADSQVFWDLTGVNAYQAYCETLLVLKQRLKLRLIVPVLPQTIDFLPETFEFAFQHKLDIVLLYCKNQFSDDELKHIRYFVRWKRCLIKQVSESFESCLCKHLLEVWITKKNIF